MPIYKPGITVQMNRAAAMTAPSTTASPRDELVRIEEKLREHKLFAKLTREKLEELADAIYMAALRAGLSVDDTISAIRSETALNAKFFEAQSGCIFSFIEPKYQNFARRIFVKRAGGGTPNAAMGKAELLLMLLSDKTDKPVSGDIRYGKREIEIKANGGKVGMGVGIEANKAVVTYCKKFGIALRNSRVGKAAKGQPMFDPTKEEDRKALGVHLPMVLGVWWKAISGKAMSKPTWPKIRRAFLSLVASNQLAAAHAELLVIAKDGRFKFFKKKSDFVTYYNRDMTRYEYRGYQKNPFSIYLDVVPEKQTESKPTRRSKGASHDTK